MKNLKKLEISYINLKYNNYIIKGILIKIRTLS